jgi:hypothetical protein
MFQIVVTVWLRVKLAKHCALIRIGFALGRLLKERESPGLRACKRESAPAASSILDETLLMSSLSTSRCEAVSAAMHMRIETLPTPPRPAG